MLRVNAVGVALAVAVALGASSLAWAEDPGAKQEVVADEEVAIGSGQVQVREFTLKRPATVEVTVAGVKNTDKGFDLHFMEADQYERFVAGKSNEINMAFEAPKVTSTTKSAVVQPGKYAVVVHNKYNIFKGMVVKLKVTVTPTSAPASAQQTP